MLDDFGTGHSSLSRLSQFPIAAIKIDRSFTARMTPPHNGLPLVRAIIDLAHDLKIEAIAEGVETDAQLSLLQQLGADLGQGHLFGQPLDRLASGTLFRAHWAGAGP